MPFDIVRADITQMETDAIVNAANNRLVGGSGVCGAIFEAAGAAQMQDACNKIGYCAVGDAVITKGFALKARYVIHTVGPIYGFDPLKQEEQLYSCYLSSLELAKKKRLKSIAFPLISSGVYGYPKAEAIKIATNAIKDFLKYNDMQIYLVVYDAKAFEISGQLFSAVQSFIDERLIKQGDDRIQSLHLIRDVQADIGASEPLVGASAPQQSICMPTVSPRSDDATVRCYAPAEDTVHFKASCEDSALPSMTEKSEEYAPLAQSALKPKKSLEELLDITSETFSQMLLRMIDEKGMTDVEVYKRANIDRKLFSKIRKKDYTPKKSTVVALIIALRLDMAESRKLLARAGYAFSECSKADIIVEYFIENRSYDIFEINETLFAFEQQPLGA